MVRVKNHEHVHSVVWDIVLTIITCWIFNLFVQYRQICSVNVMIGQQKYNFLKWLLLSFITCGIYHIYHEYIFSEDISKAMNQPDSNDGIICLLLSICGFSIVADAIQQDKINNYFENI